MIAIDAATFVFVARDHRLGLGVEVFTCAVAWHLRHISCMRARACA